MGLLAVDANRPICLHGANEDAVTFTINGSSDSEVIKGSVGAVNTFDGGDGPDQIRGGSLGDNHRLHA